MVAHWSWPVPQMCERKRWNRSSRERMSSGRESVCISRITGSLRSLNTLYMVTPPTSKRSEKVKQIMIAAISWVELKPITFCVSARLVLAAKSAKVFTLPAPTKQQRSTTCAPTAIRSSFGCLKG